MHLERKSPHKELKIIDTGNGMIFELHKSEDEIAGLIATKPLTDEKWKKMNPRELIIFENGELLTTKF
jgi:predicted glutamine amidotransferase